jgi:hypothetical protein
MADYPIAAYNIAVVALNGYLYGFGGVSGGYESPFAYRYDPAANDWTLIAFLPAARAGASAVTDGTYIYVLNGTSPSGNVNTLWRYDPATNAYTTLAYAPTSTSLQGAAYLAGRIYRIGGINGQPVNSVDVYTISSNTWAPGPDYPEAVLGLLVASSDGYIYNGRLMASSRQDLSLRRHDVGRRGGGGHERCVLSGRHGLSQRSLDRRAARKTRRIARSHGWDSVGNAWSRCQICRGLTAAGGATVGQAFYTVGSDPVAAPPRRWRYAERPARQPSRRPYRDGHAHAHRHGHGDRHR